MLVELSDHQKHMANEHCTHHTHCSRKHCAIHIPNCTQCATNLCPGKRCQLPPPVFNKTLLLTS